MLFLDWFYYLRIMCEKTYEVKCIMYLVQLPKWDNYFHPPDVYSSDAILIENRIDQIYLYIMNYIGSSRIKSESYFSLVNKRVGPSENFAQVS